MSEAAEMVRAFYAAVSRADVPTVIGLLHSDLHWTEAGGAVMMPAGSPTQVTTCL
jgi:hypothetical protein